MSSYGFTIETKQKTIHIEAADDGEALKKLKDEHGISFDDFIAIYLDDPTPKVGGRYGAPMGRPSERLDTDGKWQAQKVELDEGGYDPGGAYWGLRPRGEALFVVQDGSGNIAFIDATSREAALERAAAE